MKKLPSVDVTGHSRLVYMGLLKHMEEHGAVPVGLVSLTHYAGLRPDSVYKALVRLRKYDQVTLQVEKGYWVLYGSDGGWKTKELMEWHLYRMDQFHSGSIKDFPKSKIYNCLRQLLVGAWAMYPNGMFCRPRVLQASIPSHQQYNAFGRLCHLAAVEEWSTFREWAVAMGNLFQELPPGLVPEDFLFRATSSLRTAVSDVSWVLCGYRDVARPLYDLSRLDALVNGGYLHGKWPGGRDDDDTNER